MSLLMCLATTSTKIDEIRNVCGRCCYLYVNSTVEWERNEQATISRGLEGAHGEAGPGD